MKVIKRVKIKKLTKLFIVVTIFLFVIGFGNQILNKSKNQTQISTIEKNTPKMFVSEIYDKIKQNYWDNMTDTQLYQLFKLSFDKNGGITTLSFGNQQAVSFENKDEMLKAFMDTTKNMDEGSKNKFTTSVVETVLASLKPVGRSNLYTQQLEQQLKNTVNNVNLQKDLYKDLGLNKSASEAAVTNAFQKKTEELKKDNTPTSQTQLKEVAYARDVLTKKDTKARYDQSAIEPTIFTKIIVPGILYLQFKKFSPSSYDEFIKAFDPYKDVASLYGLIFDLRGNIGGAIDTTPYFLGNFLGKNQYAYDFYHRGEYEPFKTPTDKLPSIAKYKQVVILVDNQTQSSAEIMTASLKKYHIGVVVGTSTKGWGTVERVFPIDNQFDKTQKFSIFLVHSITLRDDNQPIEGKGVEPDINIKSTDWEQQLFAYFRNAELTNAVKQVLSNHD